MYSIRRQVVQADFAGDTNAVHTDESRENIRQNLVLTALAHITRTSIRCNRSTGCTSTTKMNQYSTRKNELLCMTCTQVRSCICKFCRVVNGDYKMRDTSDL